MRNSLPPYVPAGEPALPADHSPVGSSSLPYVPAFDGVRALAVGLVVLMHWPLHRLVLPCGWAGVNLFFVLSGLLITRILVDARGPDGRRRPLGAYLRRFYLRRTLRIFPLYYFYLALTLGGAAVLGWLTPEATRSAPLLLAYLQNWRELLLPGGLHQPDTDPLQHHLFGHLWSLAVEEQYYLLFPLLVWLLPGTWLRPVLAAIVLLVPPGRALLGELLRPLELDPGRLSALLVTITPAHLDALALGGLLALGVGQTLRHPGRWLVGAFGGALLWNLAHWWLLRRAGSTELPPLTSFGFDHPLKQFRYAPPAEAWLRVRWALTFPLVNGLSALLLLWARAGTSLARQLVGGRLVRYVGRISYGVYIWHFALAGLAGLPAVQSWASSPTREVAALGGYLILVLTVATASYFGFERWFLRWKARV